MSSIYDWVSLAIFAGLVVLFLQRATSEHAEEDVSLFYYLGAAVGCATGDYLGNHGQDVIGALVLAATIAFIFYFLKPIKFSRGA
jgi:membrane-associated phospholipid phosphatase